VSAETETAVVMNPRSGGGRTARAWERIRPRLEAVCGPVTVLETARPGHGIELTASAVRSGVSRILAVGGDGTLNEVFNGVLTAGTDFEGVVGLIPRGTGSDFRRTLRLPLEETEAIEVIRAGKTRAIDVMHVAYAREDGTEAKRYAMNVTSFGMGGQVAARANRSSKPLGGTATFLTATILTALEYRGDRVSIQMDDSRIPDARITNVAIGNGQFHGTGMWICPRAVIDDGLLDVTVVRKLSVPALLVSLRYLFNGRVYSHPKASFYRTRALHAKAIDGRGAIEIDGEPCGYLPIQVSVVPRAVRMIVT
jgi:YegS/Rv2252/BmrU family lipid kinase